MKTRNHTQLNSTRNFFRSFLGNRSGRLAAFVVMAVAVASIAVSTMSLAQTEKRLTRSASTAKPASAIPLTRKSSANQTPIKSKRTVGRYRQQQDDGSSGGGRGNGRRRHDDGTPREGRLRKARTFTGDLRQLPRESPIKAERPEREAPELNPTFFVPPRGTSAPGADAVEPQAPTGGPSAPAPTPSHSFEGLSFNLNGNGHPPDTVGDVGPNHFIQAINTSIGIYDKGTGSEITHFTFNTFMSQGSFGNLCDTNNFGDPVVLYDTFEDRWVITDFAFQLAGGAVVNPPGAYQCFAVSRTGDPVSGGWNFYSLHITDNLNDYPKFGIWPDGIYMSANMFAFPAGGSFQGSRAWVLNKAQMYAGAPSVQSVSFNVPGSDFTVIPSNARLQTGTPPTGTPNYFLSTSLFLNALTVYKFHVDWNKISLSTFTGPDIPIAASSWPNSTAPSALSLGGNNLDVLATRAMMQNQYSRLGGVESLWVAHTVRRGSTVAPFTGLAAPRFYQVPVTGGTVGPSITQAATFDPDGANVISRFMPSVAVDRAGNMALGYSTSSSSTKPAIKYAGRLSTDPINTITQTEQVLIQGAGTQTGLCGGAACTRWGDYSAMTLDPNGCTFWYTNMYYQVDGLDHHTRIGSFNLPQCTTVGSGSVQGTVTSSSGGGPISGATIALGSRTATTDPSGFYSFSNLPAGTYPSISATFPGYTSSTVNNVVVNEANITTQNFVLSPGANSACLTDTSQSDFQTGIPTNVDLNSSPGDITLLNAANLDQQNLSVTNSGFGFNATNWVGQTFQPAVTGQLTRADLDLFCSGCVGTFPNLTVSVRATSGDLPTGPDLATATIPGFNSGAGGFFAANFTTPATLTAGTRYALVVRPVANPSAGIYAYVISATNIYANGRWVTSANSGVSWVGATTGTPATSRDLGFKTFMKTGFGATGNFVSGTKDANPHLGGTVNWSTLSWTATTPAGTELKFQVAASNSASGPFNFVGPDGTAATFFTTSGASLAQFNGLRYLKYEAFLSTNSSSVTPTLNDVTVCYGNTVPTTLTVNSASGSYGGTVNLSATLTDGVSPLSGKTIDFSLNGNSAGSAVTNGSGVASVSNVSLTGINAGTYPTGVGASFAGEAPYVGSSATNSLSVAQVSAGFSNLSSPTIECSTPTVDLSGNIAFGALIPSGSVAITLDGVTQNAAIQADGSFSSTFAIGSLTPTGSPFSITYYYPGDVNFVSASGSGTLTIIDTSVPTITLNGNAISLWPVNKTYRTINVADLVASASDACDLSVTLNSVVISKVTSDEGTSSSGDVIIAANCKSVQLRQDRNANGDGRVYTITFRVKDSWGNATTASAMVTVPHDQGNGINAVDSGVAYTINGTCP